MKKLLYFIVSFLLLFSFAGCSKQQAFETDMALGDIAAAIRRSQQELPKLIQITSGDEDFSIWLSEYYSLQTGQVSDGVICYADGVEASEIAVLMMEEGEDGKATEETLKKYIGKRVNAFEGYAPLQAAMAKDGIVVANGRYIVMLICPDVQAAKAAFLDCFGNGAGGGENNTENKNSTGNGNSAGDKTVADNEKDTASTPSLETGEPTESAEMENVYNPEAVLAAYQSGDDSSLSEINRSILEAAKNALESKINDDMSDYEKELAMHDYITDWSRFDYSVFGRSGADGFEDESSTPYGVLINRSAMCYGYSSTFQLFMDMLGIECITVYGIPGSNGVQHSWNMVKLDGEWYHVDCAWDDPIGGSPCHTYFNVTSAYLRRGSIHQWDESLYPEATATTYAYTSN